MKISTKQMVSCLEATVSNFQAGRYPKEWPEDTRWVDEAMCQAIIARLRAADELAKAAKAVEEKRFISANCDCPTCSGFAKAIKAYEESTKDQSNKANHG